MKFFRQLRGLLRRDRIESDRRIEMQGHLDMQAERHQAAGLEADAARRAAERDFGNVTSWQQQAREGSGWLWLDHLSRDVRFAARGLRRSPGFALVAITTIALAIGAGAAVFALVNAVLLRSLPVPNPQHLHALHWSGTQVRLRSYNGNTFTPAGNREVHDSVNHPTYLQLRHRAAGIAELFGYFPARNATMITSATAISVDGLLVTDNFFSGLGVRPQLGRVFAPGDEAAARPEVIISHELWQNRFAGTPAVLGETVTLRNTRYTVIGVLPPGFRGIRPGKPQDFYLPLSPGSPFLYVPLSEDWHWFIGLMARMTPGHSEAELAAALSPIFTEAGKPVVNEGRIELVPGGGGLGFDRELYGRPLRIMLGVTALVMLLACANLAGLSLSRGVARTHELAVRAALGAHWRRLMAQALIESVLLAVIGGSLGGVLAIWARGTLSRLLAGSEAGLDYDLSFDFRVIVFLIGAVLFTAVFAGLLPALRAGRVDPQGGMRGRGQVGAVRLRAGRILVVAQLCLSLSILAAAGMGLRSLANLRAMSPGFRTDQLIAFRLSPLAAGFDATGLADFYARVRVALTAVPGVSAASVMEYVPLSGDQSSGGFRFADDALPPGEYHWTSRQAVDASYFATLGIPLRQGRGITADDVVDAAVKVCVVNETFARRISPDRDPIGRSFKMWDAEWRIVGVCADAKLTNVKEEIQPITYFAFPQFFHGRFKIDNAGYLVRSTLPAAALRRSIEQAVASVSPLVPVAGYTTLDRVRDGNVGRERLLAILCGVLAGVALLLCSVGLYGLIAYEVSRRTSEIAIRLAIGARPADVGRPILGEALTLAGIGIGLGLPAALGVQQLVRSQLYEVPAIDPLVLAVVGGLLLVIAVLAAWLPAWRAMKVDPQVALRSE